MIETVYKPGDLVTWRHEPRGGYGYVIPVDGEVVRTTPRRVVIRVRKRDGSMVERSVTRDRIKPVGPNYLSPQARADLDACDEYD